MLDGWDGDGFRTFIASVYVVRKDQQHTLFGEYDTTAAPGTERSKNVV